MLARAQAVLLQVRRNDRNIISSEAAKTKSVDVDVCVANGGILAVKDRLSTMLESGLFDDLILARYAAMGSDPVRNINIRVVNGADILHASCASTEQGNRREDKRSHGEVDADPDIGANTEELTMDEIMRQMNMM